jgi:hypothetical protein
VYFGGASNRAESSSAAGNGRCGDFRPVCELGIDETHNRPIVSRLRIFTPGATMYVFDTPRLWLVELGRERWEALAHHRGAALAWFIRLHGMPSAAELQRIVIRQA